MHEINIEYYKAYKISVLNYVLKDEDEMKRTGLVLKFNEVAEWGKKQQKDSQILFEDKSLNLENIKRLLEENHLLYPECLNKIYA
jgi:hypothetical protein